MLEYLEKTGIVITSLTTNRHIQTECCLKKTCHMPKYIKKKILKNLNSSSGQNNCVKSIISHLWQFLLLRKTICNKKT